MDGSLSSLLRGKSAKLVENRGIKLIVWKQGSFLGIGGDRHQRYHECAYSLEDNDESKLPIFVQDGINPPDVIELGLKLQYGLTNGIIFFVLHDSETLPAPFHPQRVSRVALYPEQSAEEFNHAGFLMGGW